MTDIVNLKKIIKSYNLGEVVVPALRGLDLRIAKGDFMAIVGASGSGKSTLLNMIGCLDLPDSGEVLFEGTNVANLTEDERSDLRNRKLGIIFQSFNLVPVLNVEENVELPLYVNTSLSAEQRAERVSTALEDVGLSQFKKHVPDKLSGGQRQRVAIARALVTQPDLILADEPTANLDSVTAHKIIDLMQELNTKRKVTFVFATHDEKLIARVQRVTRIEDGLIC